MAENRRPASWREILVFGFSAIGMTVLTASALGLAGAAVFALIKHDSTLASQSTMLGTAFFVMAMALAPGAILNLQALTGWNLPRFSINKLGVGFDILLVIIWLMLLITGEGIIRYTDREWFLLPLIAAPAGLLPIIFFARISLHDLPDRSSKNDWDIFSLGLTLGPLMIAVVEIVAAGAVILIGLLAFASNPSNLQTLETISTQMGVLTEDEILQKTIHYILNPWSIFSVLAMLSVFVPITEELLKPIGVWIGARRIIHPADGFALGVISGAGYSVFESLTAVSASVDGWAATAFARAGTDALHMLNSGLVGWALISAVQEKKYFRLAGAYITAILIHGLWNGLSIGMSFGALARIYDRPTALGDKAIAAGFGGLAVLGMIIIILLIQANRTLRKRPEQDNILTRTAIQAQATDDDP